MDEKTLARFLAKVDKNGPVPAHVPELGPCWVWTSTLDPKGYGRMVTGSRTDRSRRMRFAHRLAYEHFVGSAAGLGVCHRCDVPGCVRPDHLFAGTQTDNMADCATKGRTTRGERHWSRKNPEKVARGALSTSAKLTDADALSIRLMVAGGATYKSAGAAFGVSATLVSHIVHGKSWRSAGGPIDANVRRGAPPKIPDSAVLEIRERFAEGETRKSLAASYGVSRRLVEAIIRGQARVNARPCPGT